jgi:AraC family transcriptional regulator
LLQQLHCDGDEAEYPPATRGGLATWQARRASATLRSHLAGDVSLATIAGECGLSASRFAHAFRVTFGLPPHRWLIGQRIQVATDLLRRSTLPIVDIALRAGFSDQAALYRAFRRAMHTSPSQWRRARSVIV